MKSYRGEHGINVLIPKTADELIGVDGLDVESLQNRGWKIHQVERDDQRNPAMNRRRQDVPIVGIGQSQRRDEGLVFGDEAIRNVFIHELAAARNVRGRDVRPIGQDIPRPLVMDLVRPTGLK